MFHSTLMLREEAVGSMSFMFHTLCMYRRRAMERIVGMISFFSPYCLKGGVTVLCVRSILHDTISGHPYIPKRSDCSDLVPKTADKVNRAANVFINYPR
jgi:hypothetical protein